MTSKGMVPLKDNARITASYQPMVSKIVSVLSIDKLLLVSLAFVRHNQAIAKPLVGDVLLLILATMLLLSFEGGGFS